MYRHSTPWSVDRVSKNYTLAYIHGYFALLYICNLYVIAFGTSRKLEFLVWLLKSDILCGISFLQSFVRTTFGKQVQPRKKRSFMLLIFQHSHFLLECNVSTKSFETFDAILQSLRFKNLLFLTSKLSGRF